MNVIVENLISKIQRLRCAPLAEQAKSIAIRNCLADDVAPIVHKFADDGRFVDAANWSLDTLADGSRSKLRSTLKELQEQLRKTALQSSSISSVANDPSVTVVEKATPAITSGLQTSAFTSPLVDPDDYWAPIKTAYDEELKLIGLSPLGDRVTRACLARIEFCLKNLGNFKTNAAFPWASTENVVRSLSDNVEPAAQKIRGQCLACLNGFGEACIILTQVYAAFVRHVDLHWIANAPTPQGSLIAKSVIGSSVDEDLLDRLVWALSIVADELEQIPDPECVVQHALTRFELVVDLSAKTFFWKGEEFKESLSPANWELFAVLVEARKHWNRTVDHPDLRAREGSLKVLKVQKRRLVSSLKKQFPDLADAIKSSGRSYEFLIDRDQIEIFTRKTTESIYRLCGQSQFTPYSMDVRLPK